jgi:hypothetical protein
MSIPVTLYSKWLCTFYTQKRHDINLWCILIGIMFVVFRDIALLMARIKQKRRFIFEYSVHINMIWKLERLW